MMGCGGEDYRPSNAVLDLTVIEERLECAAHNYFLTCKASFSASLRSYLPIPC
jgi:hypothetical protein